MRGETVDGVLSFFVNYDMFIYLVNKKPPLMGELHIDIGSKE